MKARREALRAAREAPRHHGNNFTYFDTGDDHSFVGFQGFESEPVGREPDHTPEAPLVQEVEDSPAVQRLDRIRRADRQGPTEPEQPAPPAPTADQPPLVGAEQFDPAQPFPTPSNSGQPDSGQSDSGQFDPAQFNLEQYTPDEAIPEPAAPAPPSQEPVSAAASTDAFEEEVPVGYAPPPWEALAAPSDRAQMDSTRVDEDGFDLDEPAEFRKPRPFVTASQPATHQPATAEPEANQLPASQPAATEPATNQTVAQPAAVAPTSTEPSSPGDQPARTEPAVPAVPAVSPAPIDGQPSATPPPEFALTSANRPDPDEPVHIHDDPWSRTGPEVVSTAPLPRRRPDPKPSEDSSTSPPDWTKAKLPKFD